MANSAYDIVDELLRQDSAQVKKNAVTALAVMDDDQTSMRRLAEVALADADEGVRARALEEIVALPDGGFAHAARVLEEGLAEGGQRQRAYAALGYLRSLGRRVPGRVPFSLPARVKSAWLMNPYLYPVRTFPYRVRSWKAALSGSLACLLLLWPLYLVQSDWYPQTAVFGFMLLPLLAVLVCVLATQRTTPINLYHQRKIAFLIEVVTSFLFTIPVAVPLFIILWFFSQGTGRYIGSAEMAFLALISGIPPAVGLARAATLFSFGVFKGRRSNLLFQVVVAAAMVFLALAAVNFLIWINDPKVGQSWRMPDDVPHFLDRLTDSYRMLETWWACLPALAVAAAAAFAAIDRKSPPHRPIAGRLGVVASFAAVGLSASLIMCILALGRGNVEKTVNINYTFMRLQAILRAPVPGGPGPVQP
jgi:hypothetical protein